MSIPENITTQLAVKRAIPSPAMVQKRVIPIRVVMAHDRIRAAHIDNNHAIPASGDAGSFIPRNGSAMANIGSARRTIGAVRNAIARENQNQ